MTHQPACEMIEIRLIERLDKGCWDLRCSIDQVVMHSRRILATVPLTRADAKAIFNAVEQEIDSWLF